MANLVFRFGSMGASKSANLLQTAYNYRERGMAVGLFKPGSDTRDGFGSIVSRIGLSTPCGVIPEDMDFIATYGDCNDWPKVIMVDEAQFLTVEQVRQLRKIVDDRNTTVICYGLRNDFQRHLFPASAELLAIADKLEEIPTICWCGVKARFVLRLDPEGNVVTDGPQVFVGGNESYISVCSKHWAEKNTGQ